ncbi:MAG: hypothetical protein J1E40_11465 [Oscillospiraceae bacterium]|nr:hypothetical protein [Oscillospiraceae bacterium]
MYYFKNTLNRDELRLMREISEWHDPKIRFLREFAGECYIWLQKDKIGGEYRSCTDLYDPEDLFTYQECFGRYHHFYSKDRYEFLKCTPLQIIIYYHYCVVKTSNRPLEWYRGEIQDNGNILLEVFADTLEEIINSL